MDRFSNALFPRLIPVLATGLALVLSSGPVAGSDSRSRIVESSLTDLSGRNDSAITTRPDDPQPVYEPLTGERVDLDSERPRDAEALVRQDVDGNLHRLQRETTSAQTADGRKARVNESLDRSNRSALQSSEPSAALSPALSQSSASDELAQQQAESNLNRLYREPADSTPADGQKDRADERTNSEKSDSR